MKLNIEVRLGSNGKWFGVITPAEGHSMSWFGSPVEALVTGRASTYLTDEIMTSGHRTAAKAIAAAAKAAAALYEREACSRLNAAFDAQVPPAAKTTL